LRLNHFHFTSKRFTFFICSACRQNTWPMGESIIPASTGVQRVWRPRPTQCWRGALRRTGSVLLSLEISRSNRCREKRPSATASSFSKVRSIRIQFRLHEQHLRAQIPKAQKDSQVSIVFLHFWDLHAQNLLVEHWWIETWSRLHQNFVPQARNCRRIEFGKKIAVQFSLRKFKPNLWAEIHQIQMTFGKKCFSSCSREKVGQKCWWKRPTKEREDCRDRLTGILTCWFWLIFDVAND